MAKIEIYNGNTRTEELDLSDCGHTRVGKGKSVKWKVVDLPESKVGSIEDIIVRSGAEIFSEIPAFKRGKWRAKIDNNARAYAECKYSILWIPKGETELLEHDPKISVMPTSASRFIKLLIVIISAILAILTFGLLSKKIKR